MPFSVYTDYSVTISATFGFFPGDTRGPAGPFDLYSDVDGFTEPFQCCVLRSELEAGYISHIVPFGTSIIRIKTDCFDCKSWTDAYLLGYPPITPSITPTVSVTVTLSVTPTRTISVTPTISTTPTITTTPTISTTPTPTITVTRTPTTTVSITATVSITPSISITPTVTPTITYTATPTPTIQLSPSITPTPTKTISITPSLTPSSQYFNNGIQLIAGNSVEEVCGKSDSDTITVYTDTGYFPNCNYVFATPINVDTDPCIYYGTCSKIPYTHLRIPNASNNVWLVNPTNNEVSNTTACSNIPSKTRFALVQCGTNNTSAYTQLLTDAELPYSSRATTQVVFVNGAPIVSVKSGEILQGEDGNYYRALNSQNTYPGSEIRIMNVSRTGVFVGSSGTDCPPQYR